LPLESTELQNRRFITPPSKINLTYIDTYIENISNRLCGSMYVFAYKENDKPLQNSIDAIINNIKSIKLINDYSTYNIGNASMEVRNGDELQKPLSSFNKTYLDRNYGVSLRGPFQKSTKIATLYEEPRYESLASQFDSASQEAKTGVSKTIQQNLLITQNEYDLAINERSKD